MAHLFEHELFVKFHLISISGVIGLMRIKEYRYIGYQPCIGVLLRTELSTQGILIRVPVEYEVPLYRGGLV